MKTRRLFGGSVILAAFVAVAACATAGANAGASRAAKAVHPDVGDAAKTQACDACHAAATPAVVKDWSASAHGVGVVKCYVCHGSTDADFTLAPAAERCVGCHSAVVERAAAAPSGCFSCHAPHTLSAGGKPNPHRS